MYLVHTHISFRAGVDLCGNDFRSHFVFWLLTQLSCDSIRLPHNSNANSGHVLGQHMSIHHTCVYLAYAHYTSHHACTRSPRSACSFCFRVCARVSFKTQIIIIPRARRDVPLHLVFNHSARSPILYKIQNPPQNNASPNNMYQQRQ